MLKTTTRRHVITIALTTTLSFLAVQVAIAWPVAGTLQDDPVISAIRITNVTDKSFTVSWLTDVAAGGEVRYGTTPALGSTRGHDADIGSSAYVHHVTIGGLTPNTIYYFDVVSDGSVDDNGGAHYQFTTPSTGSVPGVDYAFGTVYHEDGTTPAHGAVVYVTLVDRDGSGSPGASATLSAVTNNAGAWFVNLASVRTGDYTSFFQYTATGGDDLHVQVQAGPAGMAAMAIDVGQTNDAGGNPKALPDLVLRGIADVNGDGAARAADLQDIAKRWGSQRTSPNYLARADLDADGDIDGADIRRGAAGWRQ